VLLILAAGNSNTNRRTPLVGDRKQVKNTFPEPWPQSTDATEYTQSSTPTDHGDHLVQESFCCGLWLVRGNTKHDSTSGSRHRAADWRGSQGDARHLTPARSRPHAAGAGVDQTVEPFRLRTAESRRSRCESSCTADREDRPA